MIWTKKKITSKIITVTCLLIDLREINKWGRYCTYFNEATDFTIRKEKQFTEIELF